MDVARQEHDRFVDLVELRQDQLTLMYEAGEPVTLRLVTGRGFPVKETVRDHDANA